MASYPLERAQDAAYQSNTSRLTELWSLPRPAQGLNTNKINIYIYIPLTCYCQEHLVCDAEVIFLKCREIQLC